MGAGCPFPGGEIGRRRRFGPDGACLVYLIKHWPWPIGQQRERDYTRKSEKRGVVVGVEALKLLTPLSG